MYNEKYNGISDKVTKKLGSKHFLKCALLSWNFPKKPVDLNETNSNTKKEPSIFQLEVLVRKGP